MRVAFGDNDLEIEAGKDILDALPPGIEWVHVTCEGQDVDGRTAYECDPIAGVTHWFEACPTGAPAGSSLQARPCAVCGDWPLPGSTWAGTRDCGPDGTPVWGGLGTCGDAHQWGVVLDHHRPGDPGFGRWSWMYLEASSIGQLIQALARAGVDFPNWPAVSLPRQLVSGLYYKDKIGHIACIQAGPARIIPQEVLLVAAADHCLAAAYRDQCPGVDPGKLMLWRAASRAKFQGRTVEEVIRDIEEAISTIKAAPRITLGRPLGCEPGNCEHWDTQKPKCYCDQVVIDLRGIYVPELAEAQARFGVSVIFDGIPDWDGRKKLNCMGTPDACLAFFAVLDLLGCDPDSCYGDPNRGIVWAYRIEEPKEEKR